MDKSKEKPLIDLNAALQSQGLQFKGRAESGDIIAEDLESGERMELDFNSIKSEAASQMGEDVEFEFNTPQNPLEVSPLSTKERAQLVAFGNEKGKLSWLKKKYQDVTITEDEGLVVKDKDGVWKSVDPSGLGSIVEDPWELAKDAADLLDIGIDIAAVGAGAAKGATAGAALGSVIPGVGTAAGGIAGGIAGAAGGQGLSSTLRTSLGRLLGTYEATPEENVKDVAMDMMFAAGGSGLAAGVRPTAKLFGKAMKKLARTASPAVKKTIAGIGGFLDGTKARRKLTLIENSDEVMSEMKSSLRQGLKEGKRLKVDPILQAEQITSKKIAQKTSELADEAIRGQQLRYQRGVRQILGSDDAKNLKFNLSEISDDIFKNIQDSGLATIERKNGKLFLRPPEGSQISEALKRGTLRQETQTNLNQIQTALRVLDRFKGNVEGKQAANALISLQQTMNGLKKNIDPIQGKNVIRILAEIDAGVKNKITSKLGPKLGQEFGKVNQTFGSFSEGADLARRIRAGKVDPENFVSKALDRSLNRQETEALDIMVQAAGKKGMTLRQQIEILDSAKAHIPLSPKMGLIQTGSALGPLVGGAEAAMQKAGAVLGISSPRAQAAVLSSKPVRATARTLGGINDTLLRSSNALARLPKQDLDRILSDQSLFNALVVQPLQNAAQEDDQVMQLLNDTGVTSSER